jgi:hypothetical protein
MPDHGRPLTVSGGSKAYIAPTGDGEWTERGYVAEFEVDASEPLAKAFAGWGEQSIEVTFEGFPESVTLRPDDGRDVPRLPDVSGVKLPPQPGASIVATSQGYLIYGVYTRCGACCAPVVSPFPANWRMDLRREPGQRVYLTPHRPECDSPTPPHGARVPATYVNDLTLDMDGWAK